MNMKKFLCVGTLVGTAAYPAVAGETATPTITDYTYQSSATNSAQLAQEIPCNYVRKNLNGSWTFPGTVIMSGMTMQNTTMGGGKEATILDARCGAHTK